MGTVLECVRLVAFSAVVAAIMNGCAIPGLSNPSREEVLQRLLPSAVQIIVEQQEGRRVRTGSGVVLAARRTEQRADCFILTSGHTVSGIVGQKEVYVVFGGHRGDTKKARATVLAHRDTRDIDLALLRADANRCVPAPAGRPPLLGEQVWVVGFPWGRQLTLASGIVSQINMDDMDHGADGDTASRLMVDASVSYGSSGGGVYEARAGGLIGVIEGYSTARVSPSGADPPWYIDVPVPGQTFVTPLSDVRRFLGEAGYADLVDARGAPPRLFGGGGDRAR